MPVSARSGPVPASILPAMVAIVAAGCHTVVFLGDLPDAGTVAACTACSGPEECRYDQLCVRSGGAAACLEKCDDEWRCAPGHRCVSALSGPFEVRWVCLPPEGMCDSIGFGCGTCPSGTVCDPLLERCVAPAGDGGPPICPGLTPPSGTGACCRDCRPGTQGCQDNRCATGRWCDETRCRCLVPPRDCVP